MVLHSLRIFLVSSRLKTIPSQKKLGRCTQLKLEEVLSSVAYGVDFDRVAGFSLMYLLNQIFNSAGFNIVYFQDYVALGHSSVFGRTAIGYFSHEYPVVNC